MTLLVREGLLGKEGEVVTNPDCDEIFRDHEVPAAASSASISEKIAFGPNAKIASLIMKSFVAFLFGTRCPEIFI
ncbi:MAG: hypothetical protein RIQ81_314 [Pseudomonadota bacterium]|jgi:hypothetical protein